MGRKSNLEEMARKQGTTPEAIVEDAVNRSVSQRDTAKNIGISHTALGWWLARHGKAIKISAALVSVNHHTDADKEPA